MSIVRVQIVNQVTGAVFAVRTVKVIPSGFEAPDKCLPFSAGFHPSKTPTAGSLGS